MVLIPGQKINFQYKGTSPYASNILSGNAVATGNFQVLDGTAVGNYSNITMYQDASTGIYYINISPDQSTDGNGHTFVSINYNADAVFTVVSLSNSSSSNSNLGSNSGSTTSSTTNNSSSSNMFSTLTNYLSTYKNIFVIVIAIIILFLIFYRR